MCAVLRIFLWRLLKIYLNDDIYRDNDRLTAGGSVLSDLPAEA